jgi:hypothetical protein
VRCWSDSIRKIETNLPSSGDYNVLVRIDLLVLGEAGREVERMSLKQPTIRRTGAFQCVNQFELELFLSLRILQKIIVGR